MLKPKPGRNAAEREKIAKSLEQLAKRVRMQPVRDAGITTEDQPVYDDLGTFQRMQPDFTQITVWWGP